jgi:hypothetical protein
MAYIRVYYILDDKAKSAKITKTLQKMLGDVPREGKKQPKE